MIKVSWRGVGIQPDHPEWDNVLNNMRFSGPTGFDLAKQLYMSQAGGGKAEASSTAVLVKGVKESSGTSTRWCIVPPQAG